MTDPIFVNSGEGIAPRVPRGLQHRYMTVDQQRKLAVLCRQIRADLEGCDALLEHPCIRIPPFCLASAVIRDAICTTAQFLHNICECSL